jgi:hypothetical protein
MLQEIKRDCLVFEKSIDVPEVSRISVFLQEGLQSTVDNLIMSQLCLQLLCLDPVCIDLSAMTVDQRESFANCVVDYACLRAKEEGASVLMFEIVKTNLFVLFRSIPHSRFLKEPLSNLSPTLSMLEFSDVFSPLPIESFQARFKCASIASSSGPLGPQDARNRVALWHDTSVDSDEQSFSVPELNSVRHMVEVMRQYGLCASARKRGKAKGNKKSHGPSRNRGMGRPQAAIVGWTNRKKVCILLWRDPVYVRNNAGVAYATWRYTPNDITHMDPASASTIDGKTVLFSQYGVFRVLGVSASIDFVNLEAFAVVVGGFPQGIPNSDPGLNSAAIQTSFDMQPLKRSKLLGSVAGNNICTLNFPYQTVTKWTGFPAARIDDNFAGVGGASPATVIYMPMAIRASSGAVTLLNGVNVDAKFRITVEFSELVALAV